MYRPAFRPSTGVPLVLAASLIAGAFLSRFLTENAHFGWSVFSLWLASAALVALLGLSAALLWRTVVRHALGRDPLLADALCLLPLLLLALYLFQREVDTLQASVLLLGSLSLVAILMVSRKVRKEWTDRALLTFIFFLPVAMYVKTLLPTVGEHDTFEFQVLAYRLGIAHPTGYPLYILLGKLFSFLPVGNVAYRLNLSSALFAAGATVLVYATIHLLTRHRAASALSALSFAFSYSFWSQAVVAEVYALNALLVASICYLLLRWSREATDDPRSCQAKPEARAAPVPARLLAPLGRRWALLVTASFVCGLSLTHHRTMLLLLPAVVLYLLLSRRWTGVQVASAPILIGVFAVPLVGIHLYIPIRWWQMHGKIMPVSEFTDLILGTQFAGALRWDAWLRELDRLLMYIRVLLEQYPLPALALALFGLFWLFRPGRTSTAYPGWKEGVFLLTVFIAYVLFGLSYYVPDVSLFMIPSHLVIAIALGIGISASSQLAEKWLSSLDAVPLSTGSTIVGAATLSLAALLPMSLIWTNVPRVDRSDEYANYEWGRYVLQQALPSSAVILADSEKIAPLYYLQKVEGVRADTEAEVFPDEQSNREEVERRLAEGRPVFLARFLPGLETRYHLRSLGPLVEVSTHMLTEVPVEITSSDWSFGGEVLLQGYRLDSTHVSATDTVRLTLYWEATERIAQNYDVRLRLVGPSGRVWHQTRGRPPVNGLYPTAAWRAGEIVPDFHELYLEGKVPPGRYALQVGLFAPFRQEGLAEVNTAEEYVAIAEVSISYADQWSPTIDHPMRASFDNRIMLLGYDLPSTAYPGAEIPLTLYWQRIGHVPVDYDVAIELWGSGSKLLRSSVEQPLFGEYTPSRWREGEVLADAHLVRIPPTASGLLHLRIAMQNPATKHALPVVDGWPARQQWSATLSEIRVEGLPESTSSADYSPANFEGKILLLGHEIHNVQVRKGGSLELDLTWQALAPVHEDYTVFVHLLDEYDRIWGQEDIQPVYGTRPTSQWREGETVVDPHTVWTDGNAPLGLYRVQVGLYLLRTMERLHVLDPSGNPIGDKVIIGLMEIVP
ncbi:MAG: DUF2723 domain-containing protein [Anaerolineae bacterium]|nr:DUF2723 domain-containing protein [Anaerolineae bacterium]NIN98314.1 DUF2723 domain-containing protein [Anaerolineae bacterium]NIQ81243.1 DUF2723 domain-containing protein [Anaerolineae bacterium]